MDLGNRKDLPTFPQMYLKENKAKYKTKKLTFWWNSQKDKDCITVTHDFQEYSTVK